MTTPSARLRDLALLAREDTDALREALREDAGSLGADLGVDDFRALADVDDDRVARRVIDLIGRHRKKLGIERARQNERRAEDAALQMVLSARWLDVGVELDPRLLFGGLLADSARTWIGFHVEGAEVVVSRTRLRRTAVAMRPFHDVRAVINSQVLRLRWRGGLGGLDFRSQDSTVRDPDHVLRVVLDRPRVQPVQLERVSVPPSPARLRQSWVADVIAEFIG